MQNLEQLSKLIKDPKTAALVTLGSAAALAACSAPSSIEPSRTQIAPTAESHRFAPAAASRPGENQRPNTDAQEIVITNPITGEIVTVDRLEAGYSPDLHNIRLTPKSLVDEAPDNSLLRQSITNAGIDVDQPYQITREVTAAQLKQEGKLNPNGMIMSYRNRSSFATEGVLSYFRAKFAPHTQFTNGLISAFGLDEKYLTIKGHAIAARGFIGGKLGVIGPNLANLLFDINGGDMIEKDVRNDCDNIITSAPPEAPVQPTPTEETPVVPTPTEVPPVIVVQPTPTKPVFVPPTNTSTPVTPEEEVPTHTPTPKTTHNGGPGPTDTPAPTNTETPVPGLTPTPTETAVSSPTPAPTNTTPVPTETVGLTATPIVNVTETVTPTPIGTRNTTPTAVVTTPTAAPTNIHTVPTETVGPTATPIVNVTEVLTPTPIGTPRTSTPTPGAETPVPTDTPVPPTKVPTPVPPTAAPTNTHVVPTETPGATATTVKQATEVKTPTPIGTPRVIPTQRTGGTPSVPTPPAQ